MTEIRWRSVRHPLTYEQVIAVSRQLKVELPEDYCRLIGPINGGALRNGYIITNGEKRISYSRNVSLSKESPSNIFMLFTDDNRMDKRLFPFASVGNGDYYCFDLKNKKVVLWNHELERIIDICGSFSELMKMLHDG